MCWWCRAAIKFLLLIAPTSRLAAALAGTGLEVERLGGRMQATALCRTVSYWVADLLLLVLGCSAAGRANRQQTAWLLPGCFSR